MMIARRLHPDPSALAAPETNLKKLLVNGISMSSALPNENLNKNVCEHPEIPKRGIRR